MARPKQNFKIAIPESWDEITLEKFIQLQSLYQEENKPTIKEIISVLSEIPLDELNQYPALVIEKIAECKKNSQDYSITKDMLKTLRSSWFILSFDEKRLIIDHIIDRVELDNDDIKIYYKIY